MKFYFRDTVKIIDGFYKGFVGTVTEYNEDISKYYVTNIHHENDSHYSFRTSSYFDETNLTLF